MIDQYFAHTLPGKPPTDWQPLEELSRPMRARGLKHVKARPMAPEYALGKGSVD